jgi:hypothetical protein
MTKLIVDATLPEKLVGLVHPVELCDAAGRVMGRYFPHLDPDEYDLEPPPMSEEELQRRRSPDQKTYTTAEVLEYLRKL